MSSTALHVFEGKLLTREPAGSVVTIVQNTIQLQTDPAVKEAALPNPTDTETDIFGDDATLQELVAYRKCTMQIHWRGLTYKITKRQFNHLC